MIYRNVTSAERKHLRKYIKQRIKVQNECWVWCGSFNAYGYSSGCFRGVNWLAHKLSLVAFKNKSMRSTGKPPQKQIDHLCRNKKCVNPKHLQIVTPKTNNMRSNSPAAKNMRKIFCIRGHRFSKENTIIRNHANGITTRICKACNLIRTRRTYYKKSGFIVKNKKTILRNDGVIFSSVKEAAKSSNCAVCCVSKNINGHIPSIKGFRFSHINKIRRISETNLKEIK